MLVSGGFRCGVSSCSGRAGGAARCGLSPRSAERLRWCWSLVPAAGRARGALPLFRGSAVGVLGDLVVGRGGTV